MKTFVRNILITGSLAIFASSSIIAQTSNAGFEQWYRAKYGRPAPTEQARLDTQRANPAALDATRPTVAVSTNAGFEQWYRAKYGRPSPTEEARLETQQVNAASPEATQSTVATSTRQPSPTEQASIGQIPAKDHLSKHQLKTLIATAKTPAEHQRIAQYYRSQAQNFLAQSKEHEAMVAAYKANPSMVLNKYRGNSISHCEYFAQMFSDAAAKSQDLAKQHEQMASDSGKQSGLQASSHFAASASLRK